MGFHSTGSFGATPYFIKREGRGNIMIDYRDLTQGNYLLLTLIILHFSSQYKIHSAFLNINCTRTI